MYKRSDTHLGPTGWPKARRRQGRWNLWPASAAGQGELAGCPGTVLRPRLMQTSGGWLLSGKLLEGEPWHWEQRAARLGVEARWGVKGPS